MINDLKHWSVELDEAEIVWVTIDRQGEKANTLGFEVVEEFDTVITYLEKSPAKGMVLRSGKPSGFIFGADIKEFLSLDTEQAAFDLINRTQSLLNRLEALKMPTVALISGPCLGGGMEVALSCCYRVANTEGGTLLGLPEVKLGIQPGWGGTVRLPRVIGILKAMPLLLQGKTLDAKRAKRAGFVDKAQPMRHLERAAIDLITRKPKPKRAGFVDQLCSWAPFRGFLAKKMTDQIKKTGIKKEHYPAPYAMVDNWRRYGLSQAAFMQEAKSIANLMMTPTAKQLVRVFFMQSQLKATADGDRFEGKHVHVIGAGTMGGDIAAWCALKGFRVTLQDQAADRIGPAMGRAWKLYQKKLRCDRKARLVMDRLTADVAGNGAAKADLIIEAIFEDLDVKKTLFRELEQLIKPGAILATNTSSIPLEKIAADLDDPSRLVGIHFFNPVSQMQLVEVVYDQATSPKVVQQASRFVRDIGRFPLPVKSHPGFLVNRVLMPYLIEAIGLFDEGVDVQAIDRAALNYGMPMGPIRLADTVGLDVCLSVAKNLLPIYGGEMPKILQKLVDDGNLGAKTKRGFYQYAGRSAEVVVQPEKSISYSEKEIVDRLIYRQLNEAMSVYREGIVGETDLIDAGMIYGTGFAPFRGGPIQAAKTVGVDAVLARFDELVQTYGDRFKADVGWQSLKDEQ